MGAGAEKNATNTMRIPAPDTNEKLTQAKDTSYTYDILRQETKSAVYLQGSRWRLWLNPFRAPEPLPILDPSNVVPKNGFPVVKGLIENPEEVWQAEKKERTQALSRSSHEVLVSHRANNRASTAD